MSWRRFTVLLRGLGAESRWAIHVQMEHDGEQPSFTTEDPGQMAAGFASFMGGR